ncbi:hypothetical protein D4764_20G0009400 [Takifugu flavidus]|uniref:Uncharacterized protein n=1 Tax=Takifugu flavidus TaxID=433684 RepID=A0A5C6NJI5_9TELE|nr:hypothetical protein D4764_20G0009400 [Takifugu flavidus]
MPSSTPSNSKPNIHTIPGDLVTHHQFPRCPVSHDSPTTSRALRNSGRISSTSGALPPRSFFDYLGNFRPGDMSAYPQPDGIPHHCCPPAGSGIAFTTGTNHIAATAPVSCLNNGGTEHGPVRFNVPRLPRDMVKALPEVRVEAPSDRRLCQAFPADPHRRPGAKCTCGRLYA